MYGSGLTQYGADLEIEENGDFSFYIGIGLGGKGVCSIEDDHLNYNINMYEENQNVQDTMLIGKDEIELSGYIGENISQIDQNIKFTIENEVDAGKFKQFLLGRSSNMKKCKFIKSGIAIAILGCSIIFTACDVNTDKKVEKQANKVVNAVESKDITKLDAIINGTDEIKADEELKDFFETDTEAKQKNGLMSKIIEHDTIKVKKVGKDIVTYKITAPDFSKYFTEMKKSEVTEENIESFTDDYISNAEKVTNEVEIPYTYKDGIYSAEYDTEEFVNALTGNLVTAYQELMQDVQKELSEETGDEKNN